MSNGRQRITVRRDVCGGEPPLSAPRVAPACAGAGVTGGIVGPAACACARRGQDAACWCAIPIRVAASLRRSWVCRARCAVRRRGRLRAGGARPRGRPRAGVAGTACGWRRRPAARRADRGASELARERRAFGAVAASQLDALAGTVGAQLGVRRATRRGRSGAGGGVRLGPRVDCVR